MSFSTMLSRRAVRVLPAFTKPATPRLFQQRAVHSMPPLKNLDLFSENGVHGVFSKKAFDTAWTQYQRVLVDNLNRLVGDTDLADKAVLDIAVATARQADLAATFNYASQAHNNHFFFEALSPTTISMPEALLQRISLGFPSAIALKTELLTTASKMFGAGWVWLVLDQEKNLRIVCTYNAGTPYGAAYRRQSTDMNTGENLSEITETVRYAVNGPNSNWAIPLLNINCWEHAWLEDFGVGGKDKYLAALWDAIDWNVVVTRFPFRENTVNLRNLYSN